MATASASASAGASPGIPLQGTGGGCWAGHEQGTVGTRVLWPGAGVAGACLWEVAGVCASAAGSSRLVNGRLRRSLCHSPISWAPTTQRGCMPRALPRPGASHPDVAQAGACVWPSLGPAGGFAAQSCLCPGHRVERCTLGTVVLRLQEPAPAAVAHLGSVSSLAEPRTSWGSHRRYVALGLRGAVGRAGGHRET